MAIDSEADEGFTEPAGVAEADKDSTELGVALKVDDITGWVLHPWRLFGRGTVVEVGQELIEVEHVVLTLKRGVNDTTPSAHPQGARVNLVGLALSDGMPVPETWLTEYDGDNWEEVLPIAAAGKLCVYRIEGKCFHDKDRADCHPGWPRCVFRKDIKRCICADAPTAKAQ